MNSILSACRRPPVTLRGAILCSIVAMAAAMPPARGGDCGRTACGCGPCNAGGAATPYGDTGCGRRYCGAKHDEPATPDPCDACNRWRGCNGARAMPDMLAPWQLAPGCGFRNAAQVGYAGNGGGGPCLECRSRGSHLR